MYTSQSVVARTARSSVSRKYKVIVHRSSGSNSKVSVFTLFRDHPHLTSLLGGGFQMLRSDDMRVMG